MILSFRHKGLQELFVESKTKRLPQERLKKIKMILAAIDAATSVEDLRIPAFRLHELKKPPLKGFWSIDVTGNYRIIFRFIEDGAHDVDYIDTH